MLKSFLPCTVFLLGIGAAYNSSAQTPQTPSDCKTGCTSNDVQIMRAYLVDSATLQPLSAGYQCRGSVKVRLALDLTTNTPRVGVVVYANIKFLVNGTPGNILANKKECFGTVLNRPSNQVVFSGAFTWSCGTPIALTNVFMGWGTGNTDFCQGLSAFRCPGTPSKCWSQIDGNYITIEIPMAQNVSRSLCPDTAGRTTATFNLTALNGEVSNNASNVTVTWYRDSGLLSPVGTPAAYSTVSTTAYAKVTSSTNTSAYSKAAVTLTVLAGPALSITNPTALCSPATADLTAAVTSGSTLPTGTSLSYWTNSGATASMTTPTAAGDGTYYIKASTNTTPACSDIRSVVVTVRTTPVLSITNPNAVCSPSTVDLTAAAVTSGSTLPSGSTLSYWTNSAATSSLSSPTAVGAGTYYIKASTGTTPSCSDIEAVTVSVYSNPSAPALCAVQPSMCGPATGTLTVTSPVGSTYQYSIDNGQHWQTGVTFSNVAPGSNPSIVAKDGSGCVSAAANCSDAVTCTTTARLAPPTARAEKRAPAEATPEDAVTVKVYPNPFRNSVNFRFTAPVSGSVSLEVYDNTGRRVSATSYGSISAGATRELHYSPRQKIGALLFYRLRIGSMTASGKMVQSE
ncbi:T9SS type A sorting domain-containing protein [Flaviaesturariibacter flavus]|uniref:T9SS type A sorting domain-containing protein n=1 Tax=Flaviaesturariibacter flavus TaxID=2502780 RepID=A0A4R1BMV2_9BACT|nr:T9SS type A sorting domain-containing protein [Flaviaesturariibacter flavus]TCJ18803.1 T9SS type A sorting domain-containing protein [Flaviaesturariibacter flavus]